jgi:hypothetical protein
MDYNINILKIEPFERVSSRTISSIRVSIESVSLFNSVRVRITYIDTSNTFASSEIVTLSGDDYNAWGNDDMYLYTYISKLKGITIKPSDQTPPAPSVDETPVEMPTIIPVEIPPLIPIEIPTIIPVEIPPLIPIEMPTIIPIEIPIEMPTIIPVEIPPLIPIEIPIEMPTIIPVEIPPLIPIEMPTLIPVGRPPTVSIRPPRGPRGPISKSAI